MKVLRRGRDTPGNERLGPTFRLFQSAVVSSDLADGIYKIAVPLLALGISRSALAVSAVGLAVRLPWLIATLPAGVLADRYPPRTVMRWASALRLPLVAVMCVLAATDRLPLWVLIVTAFLIGCAGTFVDVAAQSQLPRLVPVGQLRKANASLQSTQMFLAQLIGPALGGYVVALGSGGGLAVVVALYVVTVWALGLLPAAVERATASHARQTPAPVPEDGRRSSLGSLIAELGDGLRYFRGRKDLARLATAAAVNNLSYSMCLTMLPLWAVRPGRLGLSETGYGLLLTCLAVGSILAGLVAGRVLKAVGDAPVMRFGAPVLGVCFLALAVPAVPVVALGLFVYGLVSMVWNVAVTSYRQATVPLPLFGRVNAAYRWLTWGVIPFGSLAGGTLSATAGLTWVFLTAGALPLIAGALLPPPRPQAAPAPPDTTAPTAPPASEPSRAGERVTELARPGERAAEPTRPGERVTQPIRPGERVTEPALPGERAAEPTRPGERAAEPTRPGERVTQPTRPGERTAEPTQPGERAAASADAPADAPTETSGHAPGPVRAGRPDPGRREPSPADAQDTAPADRA
ncbi:MFS transporter [Streptomyces fumanus]|uniref:MFS transporter n=1 Tax=Streptomyces fumanus TaxID=67302 RepID=A0A919AC46_9ACTN|nr:MFS transporter [Streptomyces fumanus]